MPNQQTNIAAFRTGGHKLFASLSVYKGAQVIEAEAIAILPYPMKVVGMNVTSGDWQDVKHGARVEVWTADGSRRKGATRVRYGHGIYEQVLNIRENSKGFIDIQTDDILKVFDDIRLSDKLVEDTERFDPEGELVGDSNEDPRPWANSGGAVAGSTKQLPFLFTGSPSFAVDPDSGGTLTHTWTLPTGLSFAGGTGSSDADIQVTGDPGEYLITHTVEDDDNGKVTTQYIPCIIHGAGYKPHKVQIESLPNDESKGGSARVRMVGQALETDVPDGALAILWKEEYIAGTRQSFGAKTPGRSHVLFVGIIRREEGSFDSDTGVESLSFELISPLARLDELMGYGKVMLNNATPDNWNELRLLTVTRGILQLAQYYSNLNEAGYDFHITDTVTDRNYDGLFLQENTPLGQMRELAKGIQCRLVQDRRGRFELHLKPELMALSDRSSDLPVTLQLSKRDVKSWSYTQEHWRSINRVEVRGFAAGYGVEQPIFSEWVGRAPGVGNVTSIEEGAIVSGQTELNEVAGRLGAALVGEYYDADGVVQMARDVQLVLRGTYDVFDLYGEVIELTWTTAKRARDFSEQQYVLVSSDTSFEDGTAETRLRLRTCTNGAEGSTFVPPPTTDSDYIDPVTEYPETDYGYELPLSGLGYGNQRMAVVCINGVYLTVTWHYPSVAGGPTWAVVYSKPWSGTLLDWCPNGFAPGYGWVVTTTELGYLKLSDGTYVVKHTFAATSNFRSLDASFSQNGFVLVNSYYPSGGGTKALWSTDNSSFTETTVHSYDSASFAFAASCIGSKVAGKAVISVMTGSNTSAAYRTLNYGSSWAALSPAFQNSALGYAVIHSPWHNNPSDDIYYYPTANATNNEALYRNSTDVSPMESTNKYTPIASRRGMDSSVTNRLRMLMVGERDTGSFADARLWLTNDGGANWTSILTSTIIRRCALAGDSANVGWVWGSGVLQQVAISGNSATLDDKLGNLLGLTPGEIIGLAGY